MGPQSLEGQRVAVINSSVRIMSEPNSTRKGRGLARHKLYAANILGTPREFPRSSLDPQNPGGWDVSRLHGQVHDSQTIKNCILDVTQYETALR